MADLDTAFTRHMLRDTVQDVRKHCPEVKVKDAWVYHFGRDSWEFHGPAKFYWHGRAYNAYEARAKGWQAYLRHIGKES
jgi:hypothetical protein